MEKYNLKRCGMECLILYALYALISLAGDYKDHKNNWARRNLIYQLRRAELEIGATNILFVPPSSLINKDNDSYKGKNPLSPIENIQTLLQSPMAATKTLDGALDLFAFSRIGEVYETGKLTGESKYWHKVDRSAPLIGKVRSQIFDF